MSLTRSLRSGRWLAAVLACGAAACAGAPTGNAGGAPLTQLPRALTASELSLIHQTNGFALSLFGAASAEQPDSNVFLSPLSASMALGMTMNGAAGATRDAMRTALGLSSLSVPDADAAYQSLLALLGSLDPTVDMRLANSIWYRQTFAVEPAFLDTTAKYFDAAVSPLDFTSPSAPAVMNAWVDTSTDGKIPAIVDQIDPSSVMYLINAIYFKGRWTTQFDSSRTMSRPFYLADGSTRSVRMMSVTDTFAVARTGDYSAVELPYGNGAFAMDVVVPAPGSTVDQLIASLANGGWDALLASLAPQRGEIVLPRFTLTWSGNLDDALRTLGMGLAFTAGAADFSGISQSQGRTLFISAVQQKAYVAVDEQGTTAAAATSVGVSVTAAEVPLVQADRPFVFAIREPLSGTVLFIGKLMVPPLGS